MKLLLDNLEFFLRLAALAQLGVAILNPYGALIKDLCLIACAFTVWTFSPLHRPKRPRPA